ncbi:MAG: FliA/WhiG family RNA polymerase sigma factor [Selenomonadaceae bacterium]|nr:FliA/WhiG family RNA polymerase sigma factor [Selenomonadaceae bacterium]MBQ6131321.1 FliA/WhiG family RNA polymerase sigma factor [Selenomonadaceae bacterium]MBQ7493219.1 FliA/WhiG family RNA polymerase sigma factor [Selenomonadaceae bacterium]
MESDAKDMTALWLKYRENKTVELRNEIAEYYLPLVRIVCGRLAVSLPPHLDKDDLLSSGFFGLLDAIDRFDVTRNIKFETYAGVRIRGAMIDYLRSKDWIPVSMRQRIRKYEQTVCRLENELGRAATDEELAAALEISLEELATLVNQCNSATVIPLEDYLKTDAAEAIDTNPANSTELFELKETLAKAIERLPERERLVVSLYYYEEMTLKEISLVMHLTEARISQLHTKAIMRMRGYLAQSKQDLV